MNFKMLVLSFCLLLGSVQGQRTQPRLLGEVTKGSVKLYWETYSWPKDLKGFRLKKRTSKDTAWRQMHQQTIVPQVGPRNWEELGLSKDEAQAFQKVYEDYINRGKIRPKTPDYMLEMLVKYDGFQIGDRLRFKKDFNLALIMGLAMVDRSYKASQGTSYGLFLVNSNEQESALPVAVFMPERKGKYKHSEHFEVSQGLLSLSWTISEKEYAPMGLFGFKVLRKQRGGKEELLFENPIDYDRIQDTLVHWQINDVVANVKEDYIYKLTPVTIFQTQLKPIVVKYKAADHRPIKVPDIDSISLYNDVALRVKWRSDSLMPERKRIKEFYIERSKDTPLAFAKIGTKLELKSGAFVDTAQLLYQQGYAYRLCVVDKKGKIWKGKSMFVTYMGMQLPKAPDSLKVTFQMIENKPYVFLSWLPSAHAKGYILQTDEQGDGLFRENMSIAMIQNKELLYELIGKGNAAYQFRIIPVNAQGLRGTEATVSYNVPALKLPPFPSFTTILDKDNCAQLAWEYPEDMEIQGFRIWADDTALVSVNDLPPTQRKYTVPLYRTYQEKKFVVYHIEAVGPVMSKKSPISSLYIPAYKVTQPKGLVAELQKKKGKTYVKLSWTSESRDIEGYRVFVKELSGGFTQLHKKVLTETSYSYLVPDPDQDAYTFQIAAVSAEGHISPAVSIVVSLKDHQK